MMAIPVSFEYFIEQIGLVLCFPQCSLGVGFLGPPTLEPLIHLLSNFQMLLLSLLLLPPLSVSVCFCFKKSLFCILVELLEGVKLHVSDQLLILKGIC